MEKFNVINFNFNSKRFEQYDVIPHFVRVYNERRENHKKHPNDEYFKVPETFEDFKKFVKEEAQYHFWSRCEYEIILVDWPTQDIEEKWDVYDQIMMNLDIITELVMKSI